ncbi:MAG TPA: crosslink repair DNA glycosylase YcaQ family protein [Ilumatobacteraceae bacterium]|nr:crosslink repair DNA glycosylase YcaQ family protein [Ilumatobacteraceae bacterium]
MAAEKVSLASARRIALGAQGFADPRPKGRVDRRHFRRVLDRMGLIQIDSVNVLVRSQELPLFARLGPHPRTMISDATKSGELFEYWVHEASHVDMAHYQLHRWKMMLEHKWGRWWTLEERRPGYVDEVYRRIADDGPVVSGDLSERVEKKGPWWDWDDAKVALEHLFWKGRVSVTRRTDFARIYDLTERVIPAEVLARPDVPEAEARKQLLELAARHHGIASFTDLTDYHRQANQACKPLVAELVEEGTLREVEVEGWKKPAYVHHQARIPRRISACALLSPFDPIVWNRDRAMRLFGFHYRIEIYTPQPKRIYGYYVLPILWGDSIVGRLDMKSDRQGGALLIQGSFTEPGVPAGALADDLAPELLAMAQWLGLDRVEVLPRGDLASTLRDAVGHYARR